MLALIVLLSSWAISDRVEAIVGDFPILRSDVIARMVESPDYGSDPGADSALFASTLDGIVDERLLVEGARAAGFFPSAQSISEMVESRMVETRAGFATEEQYLAALAAAGLTEERLRSDLTALMGDQRAASDFVHSRTARDMASLPADPVRYLNSNLPLLEEELMPRNLSWILIPVLPGGPDADSALAFLRGLEARIGSGESFGELAAMYSQDPGSSASGGSLGAFAPGDMTPTFESALVPLAPGGISEPFLSPYGAHLARLDSRDSTGIMEASHILLLLELTREDLDRAVELADSVAGLIRSGSTGFAEAAMRWSVDPLTSDRGGDIGIVMVREYIPEAAGLLASSEAGDVSGPVPLGDGSAVALLLDRGSESGFDWTGFDDRWLYELVRSVIYRHGIETLVDSLRTAIPVLYAPDES